MGSEKEKQRRKLEGLTRVSPNPEVFGNVVSRLDRRVIGQPLASQAVAEALLTFSAGMNEPNKPLGVFLFLGPTGVGKTEMGKGIADFWADGRQDMDNLRIIAMNEFSEAHSALRFTGAPPSYVGNDEKSRLDHEWANRQQRKVVLFDEIEKAHPKVLNVLMDIFDNGKITARNGTKGDQPIFFPNTLFICTTNAGSTAIVETARRRPLGFHVPGKDDTQQRVQEAALKELQHTFRPEILGRMDKVVFNSLERPHFHEILSKFLNQYNAHALTQERPCVYLSSEAREMVVDAAWPERHENGRALKRAFRRVVVTQVAKLLETGAIQPTWKVRFEVEDDELVTYGGPDKARKQEQRAIVPFYLEDGADLLQAEEDEGPGNDPDGRLRRRWR